MLADIMLDWCFLKGCESAAVWTTVALAVVASGGCAGGIISQRYSQEPNCAAEIEEGKTAWGRGIPIAAWPGINLPRCLKREGRHALHQNFNELLQPEPAPPLKPPHSRFHPLPTQPVFAQRSEYTQPELLQAVTTGPSTQFVGPPAEEIPVPIPEPLPVDATMREVPALKPVIPPRSQNSPPPARPIDTLPATPPKDDASRGSIAPASFTWAVEPNPLRDSARTTSTQMRR